MKAKFLAAVLILSVMSVIADKSYACNQSPTAILSASPEYVILGESVMLDGSDSHDHDGSITKYEWDFTNNGSYDYYETSSYHPDGAFDGKTTYTYSSPVTYTAKLRVTDDKSATSTDTCTVSVSDRYYVDTNGSDTDNGLSWATAFATIQKGLNSTSAEIVEVNEGTYYETIDFNGVNCKLTSTDPNDWSVVEATIIDANGSGNAVTVNNSSAVLKGFTITGGNSTSGGGIYCGSYSPTISKCISRGNTGYGMYTSGGSAAITDCIFSNNSSGGLHLGGSSTVTNCIFSGNKSTGLANVYLSGSAVINCTFYGNLGAPSGGLFNYYAQNTTATNCIFWNNAGPEIGNSGGPAPTVTYCDVEGGYTGTGNINSAPNFANVFDFADKTTAAGTTTTIKVADASGYEINDVIEYDDDGVVRTVTDVNTTTDIVTFSTALGSSSASGVMIYNWGVGATDLTEDYYLTSGSACIDAANGTAAPSIDILGHIRFDVLAVDNTGTGSPAYTDMGAYEYGDLDQDGMPDPWEIEHGLDPNDPNDADSDLDSDGYSNVVEYLHDGDPNVPNAALLAITLHISSNANPIQQWINWSIDGDVIEVAPGTYYENIDFDGTAVTVRSTDPNDWDIVEATIIDGNSSGDVVTFDSGEGSSPVVIGFTIINGTDGVVCSNSSSPTIAQCIIKNNSSNGIYCTSGSPLITNNIIAENGGDGIYSSSSTPPTIKNNWIYDNVNGIGFSSAASAATVQSNTIVDNTGVGIYVSSGDEPDITNCILWSNNNDLYGCSTTYSCIEDGDSGTGNISSYAYFEDFDSNDFHLTWNSPCINRGDPNGSYTGWTDIDGEGRVADEEFVDARIDMGADEMALQNINLVQNPGFEDGFSNWTHSSNGGSATIDTSDPYEGSNCLKMELNEGTWQATYQTIGTLSIGKDYLLSVMFKSSPSHGAYINLYDTEWKNSEGSVVGKSFITAKYGNDKWHNVKLFVNIPLVDDYNESTEDHNWRVYLYGHWPAGDNDPVYYDSIKLSFASPEFLPPYGCMNEPNNSETIDFGGGEANNENWVSGTITSYMSGPSTDSNDNNITYRELKANKTLTVEFPAFNLDPGYDANDPNDPNGFPLTPMLLEVMYKDTVDDNTNGYTSYSDLAIVESKNDYINLDADYLRSSNKNYGIGRLGGNSDNKWKYMQYGFQKSNFQLLRAIDGNFTIRITNQSDANIPIDYMSLRKITQAEYEDLTNKQRAVRGFYEVDLPTDVPNDSNYVDPNLVVFCRDIMRPVYKHTRPDVTEPNSISAFSCWGEVEPVSFSIYSENGVNDLGIEVSNLTHEDYSSDVIDSNKISIYRVIHDETRLGYYSPTVTATTSYALLPEYLEEFGTLSVEPNTSESVWLKIQIPSEDANLSPGVYQGQITIERYGEPNVYVPIDVNIYDITLDNSNHINAVYHCPYTHVFSTDLDTVYDAYRETEVGPFIYNYTHPVIAVASEDPNDSYGVVFDSNNFETALDRMIDEGIVNSGDKVCLNISTNTWMLNAGGHSNLYTIVMGSSLDSSDPNLWYKLSEPNFVGAFEKLLGVYADIANDPNRNIEFIYQVSDEPEVNPYKRIISDRIYTIIKDCNDPCGLKTGCTYYTGCDNEIAPGIYNTPNDINIPPLTDLVDYKIWHPDFIDAGYANHQNPNYHGNFGYYTTGHSHWANPIYNRFLHGLFAFGSDATVITAYAMGDSVNDPYNDFDASYNYIFPFTYPDFLYAYPTWDGKLLPALGGLEAIREGIKDARYIATLQNILNDPNTDWNDANVVDANDYLVDLKSSIDPNYNTAYSDQGTELGYYKAIIEDISDANDSNDFEVFTNIRQTIADYIDIILDPDK